MKIIFSESPDGAVSNILGHTFSIFWYPTDWYDDVSFSTTLPFSPYFDQRLISGSYATAQVTYSSTFHVTHQLDEPTTVAELVFDIADDAEAQTIYFGFDDNAWNTLVVSSYDSGFGFNIPVTVFPDAIPGGSLTIVPEPATVAIWSVLALCGLAYGFRNKSAKRS